MKLYEEGDLVFDIGACIGEFTGHYLSRGARVVSVEPEERNIATLCEKFGDNENVMIVPKAVGAEVGRQQLAVNEGSCTISSFVHEQFWGPDSPFLGTKVSWMQEVEVTTLDALIEEFGRPQYCKIDVEGFENQVLRGLSMPIPLLQFEFGVVTVKEGWTKECVECIVELSPHAEFAYCAMQSSSFSEQMPAEELLRAIDVEISLNSLYWGNIVADMRKDC